MIRNYIRASAVVVLCSGTMVMAQAGQAQQQAQPTTQSNTAVSQSTTLTGCVYRERDVPGRAPNVAERAGILEDYILTDVKQGTSSSGVSGAAATSGTAKTSAMYKLELVADEKLQTMVGKRVEVMGRVDAEAGDKPPTAATPPTTQTDQVIGRDRVDLPEFEVTSIREVTGTCPAKPSVQ